MRLDSLLASKHDCTRSQAAALIRDSLVEVDSKLVTRPSFRVSEDSSLSISKDAFIDGQLCVSRGALKLKHFLSNMHDLSLAIKPTSKPSLEALKLDIQALIKDSVILDIGASSGGFTQTLLAYGARMVIAQDVGSLQLDSRLRDDRRVVSLENLDLREFSARLGVHLGVAMAASNCDSRGLHRLNQASRQSPPAPFRPIRLSSFKPKPFDFLTCDVSFISLHKLLDSMYPLSSNFLLLFKPQFEVGRHAKRNKRGVVVDVVAIESARLAFVEKLKIAGAFGIHIERARPKGRVGNEEFFIFCRF